MKAIITIWNICVLLLCISYNVNAQQKGTVTDIDGNVYETIYIGDQVWMTENLRTTTYSDGTPITLNESEWFYNSSEAYCWYENDKTSYGNLFGALYNWYTLINENICPKGWHVPSDSEWKILEGFVDSQFGIGDSEWDKTGLRGFDAGMKLKTTTWDIYSNSINGTNNYGFNAYPSGIRASCGDFVGGICQWWSYSSNDTLVWRRIIHHNENTIGRETSGKSNGYSIRCIKNTDTSVSKIDNNFSFTIYPNPTKGNLFIKSPYQNGVTVFIYTISGKLIYSEKIYRSINSLNLTSLNKGIYIIKIQNRNTLKIDRLIIQ